MRSIEIKVFKTMLVLEGKTAKEFAEEHGLNVLYFQQALSGNRSLSDDFKKAINEYLKKFRDIYNVAINEYLGNPEFHDFLLGFHAETRITPQFGKEDYEAIFKERPNEAMIVLFPSSEKSFPILFQESLKEIGIMVSVFPVREGKGYGVFIDGPNILKYMDYMYGDKKNA